MGPALLLASLAILRRRETGGGLVWLAAFIAILAIRTPYGLRNRENVIIDSRNDRAEQALLAAAALTAVVLPLIDLATPLFAFADYDVPNWATVAGAVLQIPLLWLFWRTGRLLAKLGRYGH